MRDQERAAGLERGLLEELVESGQVVVAHGKRVADVEVLLDHLPQVPIEGVVADRFQAASLQDALAARGAPPAEWRINQWSTASYDVAALRALVADGPLRPALESEVLLNVGLGEAAVETDTSGNSRLRKANWKRRDDVAQALVLASGAVRRWPVPAPLGFAAL